MNAETVKTIAPEHADTCLERHVLNWMNERAEDYEDTGVEGVYKDLMYGGCISGYVGELIYTADCERFYAEHESDIAALLTEMMSEVGTDGPAVLFGEKWDNADPLARDSDNRNLLAWFGFEEAARIVADRAGLEF